MGATACSNIIILCRMTYLFYGSFSKLWARRLSGEVGAIFGEIRDIKYLFQ